MGFYTGSGTGQDGARYKVKPHEFNPEPPLYATLMQGAQIDYHVVLEGETSHYQRNKMRRTHQRLTYLAEALACKLFAAYRWQRSYYTIWNDEERYYGMNIDNPSRRPLRSRSRSCSRCVKAGISIERL